MDVLKNLKFNHTKQPCCGFFLQGGVKAVAIVDFCIQLSMIIILAVGIIVGQPVWWADSPDRHFARPFYWTFYFFYFVTSMGLSVFLFISATARNGRNLTRYLITSIVLYVPWVCLYTSHSIWLHGLHAMVITTYGGVTVFKFYSFWVIKSFINEISYYGGFNAALKELTDAEIEEFEKGHPTIRDDPEYTQSNFQKRPYKKDFEISIDLLELDEKTPLGSGAFGTVLKGNLYSVPYKGEAGGVANNNNTGQPVAVKTVAPTADVTYFKALLSELKILSYIGKHENIVNLIGACTSQIREKKIYVIVEFCPYGNLMNYLRANRGLFVNLIYDGEILTPSEDSPYVNKIPDSPCTLDLLKWSMQTARGMEYIASKKVIHGDLAGRNVLLTHDKNVKIADFGLSRQLYHYTTYIKHNEEPLPWRWMSVESLCDMNFSSQSDIWSYGITLYEYFTCGQTPYPGYYYSGDFVKQLKNGLRPEQPQYSNKEIYQIMQRCWELEPRSRPTFTELGYYFEKLIQRHTSPSKSHEHSESESGTFGSEHGLDVIGCCNTYNPSYMTAINIDDDDDGYNNETGDKYFVNPL